MKEITRIVSGDNKVLNVGAEVLKFDNFTKCVKHSVKCSKRVRYDTVTSENIELPLISHNILLIL
jgi:hypothetical protein